MSDGSDPRRDVAPPTDGNPVVARLWRGGHVESIHRGAWVVVDTAGNVIDGRGDPEQPIFARSSTKSIQLLPLLESGAAATLGVTDDEIAVSIASHNGEPIHVDAARSLLARARLSDDHLRCGPQRPAGGGDDSPATRITNN
ncbi:MAG: asparaginase, partial [Acidimicrobiia bacterium]|nr:asparaginase [Acidimicrobiia bacterium]